jgi:hypothetical protein
VADLRFDEFFKLPVGPKGIEVSPRLAGLDGKKVRILGYMVKQARPTPWTLLLSPVPVASNEAEYGLAEDLPPSLVRVSLPRSHQPITPHTPGLLLLTGTVEVGDREEPDGRHSLVRLQVDRQPWPVPGAVTNATSGVGSATAPQGPQPR